jgi:hypothetical protein
VRLCAAGAAGAAPAGAPAGGGTLSPAPAFSALVPALLDVSSLGLHAAHITAIRTNASQFRTGAI